MAAPLAPAVSRPMARQMKRRARWRIPMKTELRGEGIAPLQSGCAYSRRYRLSRVSKMAGFWCRHRRNARQIQCTVRSPYGLVWRGICQLFLYRLLQYMSPCNGDRIRRAAADIQRSDCQLAAQIDAERSASNFRSCICTTAVSKSGLVIRAPMLSRRMNGPSHRSFACSSKSSCKTPCGSLCQQAGA